MTASPLAPEPLPDSGVETRGKSGGWFAPAIGLGLVGASLTSLVLQLFVGKALDQFLQRNVLPPRARNAEVAVLSVVSLLAMAGAVLFTVKRPARASKAFAVACPLLLSCFFPALFLRGGWENREL